MNKYCNVTQKKFSLGFPDASTMEENLGRSAFRHKEIVELMLDEDSQPHSPSECTGRVFYEQLKNSTQTYRNEIYDIYFGGKFQYNDIVYGNVMGVYASEEAVDWLFKIQNEFCIPISLTLNQLNVTPELYSRNALDKLIAYIGGFYDRGLRSCTIGNIHLMRMNILQKSFPDMLWKNTVNHIVLNTQMVVDYIEVGYNFIQLDRSLNRNMEELKSIRKYVDNYNKKYQKNILLGLLVKEECLPYCPFKREHDNMQEILGSGKDNYWENLGQYTCNAWRKKPYHRLPRHGTDLYWVGVDTFIEYAELVDVFKWSGRLDTNLLPDSVIDEGEILFNCYGVKVEKTPYIISSFSEIIEQGLEPLQIWERMWVNRKIYSSCGTLEQFKSLTDNDSYRASKYYALEQVLKNCRSQCYKCHLCEKVFGIPPIDSLLSL